MTDPGHRYRRLFGLYPTEYRETHGQEIMATLLDAASDCGGPTFRDAVSIMTHALRVHVRLIAVRFGRGTMPRSVRLAANILLFLAASSWFREATTDSGPLNQKSPVGNVVVGIVLVALCLLLRARSRLLYIVVIATLVSFVATIVSGTTPFYAGFVLGAPFIGPLVLLIVGWRSYMAVIPSHGTTNGQEQTLAS